MICSSTAYLIEIFSDNFFCELTANCVTAKTRLELQHTIDGVFNSQQIDLIDKVKCSYSTGRTLPHKTLLQVQHTIDVIQQLTTSREGFLITFIVSLVLRKLQHKHLTTQLQDFLITLGAEFTANRFNWFCKVFQCYWENRST